MEAEALHPTSLLFAACAADLDRAWSRLHERLSPRVRRAVVSALVLYGESPTPELVEDLTQEIWCRLLEADRRALARFRGDSEPAACLYLRRVVGSVVLDRLRAGWTRRRRPAGMVSLESVGAEVACRADPSAGPEQRLLARERLRHLLTLCRRLLGPKAGRDRMQIARLALLEGWRSDEIAARLDGRFTVGAIDCFLSRLRTRLADHGLSVALRSRGRSAHCSARLGS